MKKDHQGWNVKPAADKIDPEKPTMFLRKGVKGGLFFFSPKGKTIYYMAGNHVRELLDGKREFAVIHKGLKQENVH